MQGSKMLRYMFFVLAFVLIVFGLIRWDVAELLQNVLQRIRDLGPKGPFIFILAYMAACVFFLPGSILTLGAGAIYGPVMGTLLVSVASTAGASLAFLVGRFLARDKISSLAYKHEKFKMIDEAIGREGAKIVFLTRLSPIFPFNLLNYALGLTRVSFSSYVLASWIGMFPGTLLYVYLGSVAGEASRGGAESKSWGEWALTLLGLIATLLVTIKITSIARQTLDKRIGE